MKILKTEDLVSLLQSISKSILEGDSFEGNLTYSCIGTGEVPLGKDEFEVEGCFRVGNSEGQGGMVVL